MKSILLLPFLLAFPLASCSAESHFSSTEVDDSWLSPVEAKDGEWKQVSNIGLGWRIYTQEDLEKMKSPQAPEAKP